MELLPADVVAFWLCLGTPGTQIDSANDTCPKFKTDLGEVTTLICELYRDRLIIQDLKVHCIHEASFMSISPVC